MSDWKSRATPVKENGSDWKSRATPAQDDDQSSTLQDLLTGVESSLPSRTVAGAAQAIPDAVQAKLHELMPSLVGQSPTQVNEALAKLGINSGKPVGPTSSADLYNEGKQEQAKVEDKASTNSPYANFAGQMVGGTLPLALTGPTVAAGAALGAAQGLDKSKAPVQDIPGQLESGAVGGALGAGGAYVGNKLASAITPASLSSVASNTAARMAGVKASRNAATGIGQTLLDNNAVPFTGGADALSEAIQNARTSNYKDKLSPILQQIQDGLGSNDATGSNKLVQNAEGTFSDWAQQTSNRSDAPQIINKVQKEFDPYVQKLADAGDDVSKLNSMKQGLQKQEQAAYQVLANGQKEPTPESDFFMQLAGQVKQHIQDLGNSVDNGLGEDLAQANKTSGNLKEAGKSATKLADRQDASSPLNSIYNLVNAPLKMVKQPIQAATARGANAASKAADALGTDSPFAQFLGKSLGGNPARTEDVQAPVDDTAKQFLPAPKISQPSGSSASNGSNDIMDTSHTLYNANDDTLSALGAHLASIGHSAVGESLQDAITNKDDQRKNAALFTIMQNPQLRKAIS